MREKKWLLPMLLVLVVALSACGGKKDAASSAAASAASSAPAAAASSSAVTDPSKQALEQAQQAGLIDKDKTQDDITSAEAEQLVSETLTDANVSLSGDTLQVGEGSAVREYYVFDVTDKTGAPVGKVAVDKVSGEKYNYLGEGTIEDYASFPLYDPAVDAVCNWEGSYATGSMTLEILQGDSSSFEYHFSDGTTGHASISGNTAKSSDGSINFLFTDQAMTVAGGTVTGNYKRDAAQQ